MRKVAFFLANPHPINTHTHYTRTIYYTCTCKHSCLHYRSCQILTKFGRLLDSFHIDIDQRDGPFAWTTRTCSDHFQCVWREKQQCGAPTKSHKLKAANLILLDSFDNHAHIRIKWSQEKEHAITPIFVKVLSWFSTWFGNRFPCCVCMCGCLFVFACVWILLPSTTWLCLLSHPCEVQAFTGIFESVDICTWIPFVNSNTLMRSTEACNVWVCMVNVCVELMRNAFANISHIGDQRHVWGDSPIRLNSHAIIFVVYRKVYACERKLELLCIWRVRKQAACSTLIWFTYTIFVSVLLRLNVDIILTTQFKQATAARAKSFLENVIICLCLNQ